MTAEPKPLTKMQALKERRGGAPQALLDSVREANAAKTAIKRALAEGPLTVPEIAAVAELEPRQVLWTLTAMRKYGTAVEDSTAGSYVRYALTPKEPRS